MGAVVALSGLVEARRVWRGRAEAVPTGCQPTGLAGRLDRRNPSAVGWDGELRLVLPIPARLTQGRRLLVVAPSRVPFAKGWRQRGLRLNWVHSMMTPEADVLWAAEQCLCSGACAAVLVWWPKLTDDRALHLAAGGHGR